jgi:dihydroxy-acid dehydratase
MAEGKIDYPQFLKLVASSAPSTGHCNTMGTASTMNSLAEALGLMLPGTAAIPAPYRDRQEAAYLTGKRIVEMVRENLKPSDILTRNAFENCIAACSAIGGSTNAPVHINAIARHIGVELSNDDWEKIGYELPLLVNLQPAGEYLAEEYYRAGGLPAVVAELVKKGKIKDAITVNGKTLAQNCEGKFASDRKVIFAYDKPMKKKAGFLNMKGNLFDSAIMKTSVITDEFRQRYLENPADPMAFEGTAVVFDGPEDYHARIDDPKTKITAQSVLFIRGVGPVGYPGAAEVVNMRAPSYLLKKGVTALPCIGDGRQSGTSGSPSILNASPEAATGGGLALVQSGDKVRIDLKKRRANMLVDDAELARRRAALEAKGGYPYPPSQTPWQEIQRGVVDELANGMVLKPAVKYQKIHASFGLPRDNH